MAVGGHARSHVPLTALPPGEAEAEIADCRRAVGVLAGVPPIGFDYPHDERNDAIAGMVEDQRFARAVTTRQDTVGPGRPNRYALPRIAVGGWSRAELLRKIAWRGG